jgi:hypothetical protein
MINDENIARNLEIDTLGEINRRESANSGKRQMQIASLFACERAD